MSVSPESERRHVVQDAREVVEREVFAREDQLLVAPRVPLHRDACTPTTIQYRFNDNIAQVVELKTFSIYLTVL